MRVLRAIPLSLNKRKKICIFLENWAIKSNEIAIFYKLFALASLGHTYLFRTISNFGIFEHWKLKFSFQTLPSPSDRSYVEVWYFTNLVTKSEKNHFSKILIKWLWKLSKSEQYDQLNTNFRLIFLLVDLISWKSLETRFQKKKKRFKIDEINKFY